MMGLQIGSRSCRHPSTRAYVVLAVCCLLASLGIVRALTPVSTTPQGGLGTLSDDERENFIVAWRQQPRVDVGVEAHGATVVIVKFNDFECPGCAQAEALYRPVLESFNASHPGAVAYVVKDWPWNATCNFNATSTIPGHEASCDAAAAARMARDRGESQYAAMTTWLYGNQGVAPQAVREAAARLLGVSDFEHELALKLPEIQRDIADGGVLRINSTPTYFVNGIRLPAGIVPPAYVELAISLELTAATGERE